MPQIRNSRFTLALMAFITAFVAVPATGFAQNAGDDPSSAQYDPPIPAPASGGGAGSGSGSGSGAGSGSESGLDSPIGALPFTGQDLLILLAVAAFLVATGYGLRKLSTPRGPEA